MNDLGENGRVPASVVVLPAAGEVFVEIVALKFFSDESRLPCLYFSLLCARVITDKELGVKSTINCNFMGISELSNNSGSRVRLHILLSD